MGRTGERGVEEKGGMRVGGGRGLNWDLGGLWVAATKGERVEEGKPRSLLPPPLLSKSL